MDRHSSLSRKYSHHITLTHNGSEYKFGCYGKLPAITIVRHITQLGLRDAKDLVETGTYSGDEWSCITEVENWCCECDAPATTVVNHHYQRRLYCNDHTPQVYAL